MADGTTTPNAEETTQTPTAEGSGSGNGPRTFTQADVDRIVQERLARAKSTPPADYDDLKAKAAKYDELAEANKSDLERANDAASRAKADADEWKAKFEALQAEQERMTSVQAMAAQYRVDAGTLSRMAGDVEDNAKYLAGVEAARPKFGSMSDGGEKQPPAQTLAEALKGVKSTAERIRIREEFNARNHNR